MNEISDDEKQEFHRNGFLLIKNCFSKQEIEEAIKKTEEFAKRQPKEWEMGKEMAYYETSQNNTNRILMRVENYVDFHKIFYSFAYSKKILGIIEELMNEEFVLFKDKINFKKPGGGGFRPHQDKTTKWGQYGTIFLNAMITLTESTIDNGCLEVAPGVHKEGLISKDDSGLLTDEQTEGMSFTKIPTSPGDVIFFDAFTPHKSKSNLTDKERINLYLTYNRKIEGEHRKEYFLEKRREFPPDNERDVGITIENSKVHEASYS
mgnify:CR=1 FL=1|tara:strand:+ start:1411 stop:2199 length:789 start_codon:yes stop_codon:yes gene_type:complete